MFSKQLNSFEVVYFVSFDVTNTYETLVGLDVMVVSTSSVIASILLSSSCKMSAHNDLPELFLSKKRARFLLTRNASVSEQFRKKSSLIDKAKCEEEKAFEREKERILQSQSRTEQRVQTPLRYARFEFSKNNSQLLNEENRR